MTARQTALSALLAFTAVLSGCGGGSGGSDDVAAPPAPPAPPAVAAITREAAWRFLNQATYGAREGDVQAVIDRGYADWIDAQLALPASLELPFVTAAGEALAPGADFTLLHRDRVEIWLRHAMQAPDQLRLRVAFALSEIMVVSQASMLVGLPWGSADYYDMLARNAFGSFRSLIEGVTLHPAMGVYLSMLGNQKPDAARNIRPDENYARELMQLFTIGLVELEPDGSVRRDALDQPVPTYDQGVIEGFAHVYTGWNWGGYTSFDRAQATIASQTRSMQAYPEQHANGSKQVLRYPGATLTEVPANQSPAADLAAALDNIAGHPNVAPFIGKQLIQKLVTSNPSPQYVERIARVFDNDGRGVRGNLGAVVKAILLDAEARSPSSSATNGKLKEPLLRLTQLWRALDAASPSGRYNAQSPASYIGQGPLQAPSVFNFFSPSFAPSVEIREQGLVAPEMQITTEYTTTLLTDFIFVQAYCYNGAPVQGCPPVRPELFNDVVSIDLGAERALAGDARQLVDRLEQRLVGAPLSPTLRAQVLSQVERVPATERSLRVAEALFLIATAPEVAAQR